MYLQKLHSEHINAHFKKTIKHFSHLCHLYIKTVRVLSPSRGGMTVKKKVKGSSVTLKVTRLNVISTFCGLNDSISFVDVIFSPVD